MTDFTAEVKAYNANNRYPLEKMIEVGDYFDVTDMSSKSISVHISRYLENKEDRLRRFHVFGRYTGCRVILIDTARERKTIHG